MKKFQGCRISDGRMAILIVIAILLIDQTIKILVKTNMTLHESIFIAADRYIDIGDLYLLRALAKVEVICKETPYLELHSVQLTGYNTNGYCEIGRASCRERVF